MVYILHFERKHFHAQHYIGWVSDKKGVESRILKHMSGTGSKLMFAIVNLGIPFVIARIWPNESRQFERKLKNWKKASDLCPICKANKKKK